MDAAVNGTWLAYKWAIEDGDEEAKAALESLILNWPFDFHLFQSDAAESAAPKLEDKILQFMVNIPLETERLRDFFGLEGKHLMMIVARDARGDSHAEAVQGDPDVEGDTHVACSEYSAVFGQSAHGVEGGKPLCCPKPEIRMFCCGAPGELQAFVVLINFDVVAHNPKLAFFVGPQASSKRSWF